MATEIKAKYKSTEVELYAIGDLLFNNLRADLAQFVLKKAKYTALFVDGLDLLRTDAMALPDEEQRNGVHQILKNQLPGVLTPVKDNFNDLKGYIRDAWPNEDPKPRYEAAGLVKYNAIGESNWENVAGLCESMVQFINDGSVELTAPGGMVVTFLNKVKADRDAFKDVYDPFLSSRETGTARAAKINANNTLYDAVIEFFRDGVEMVFRTNDEAKKRYTFSVLKDLVSPPGSASMRVFGKTAADILLANRPVTIKKEGSAAITSTLGVDGIKVFENIDPGKYKGTVEVDGVLIEFEKEVDTGVNARVTVVAP